jgi:hypothetical protein
MTVDPCRAMRTSFRSTIAAAILPAALLTAACGTSPLEPTAPAAASAQPQNLHGFVVSWGNKKPKAEPAPAQPQNLHGFVVSWGSKKPKAEPAPVQPANLHGFVVSWGQHGGQ